ncbi:AT-rich interactive domain-containing protein 4A [Trichinella spiralis]|uniref:AT-rich interactive domain-containing protein 4A n=1 Tax=Trichinella spiralis TaxID=6334 RepID=A0ABR3KJX0_TRISP
MSKNSLDPLFFPIGSEVSARFKGSFCQAIVKAIVPHLYCKIQSNGTYFEVELNNVIGDVKVGNHVWFRNPYNGNYNRGVIKVVKDKSDYTVDFDDGDEQTLRRHQLCLRASSSPAPMECQVRSDAGSSGARVLQFAASSGGDSGTSATSDVSAPVDANLVVGAVVIVQRNLPDLQQLIGESVDLTNQCFPALVVTPSAAPHLHCQSTTDHVVRSFITGELSVVTASEVRSIDEWHGREIDNFVLRRGLENAKVYLEQGKLPCGWDKDVLLAAGTSAVRDVSGELSAGEDTSKTTESSDVDSEDETNDEDRDHFVACLYKFMDERNTPINKCPMLAGKDLDLYHFYRKVMRAGGYTRVSNKNLWKVITDKMSHSLGVNLTVKSVRVAYESFLLSFENFTRKLGFPFKQYTPVTPRNATSRNEKEWMRSKALAEKIQAGDSTSASRKRKKYAEGGSDEAHKEESGQKTAGGDGGDGDGGSGTVAEQQQKKPSGETVVVKVEAHPSDSKKLRLVVTGDKHKTLSVVKGLEPNGGDNGNKAKAAATTVGSDDDGGSSNAKKQLKRTGDCDDGGVESVKKKLKPAAKVGKGKEIIKGEAPAAAVPAKRGQTTAISKSLRSKHVVTAESTSVVSDRVSRAPPKRRAVSSSSDIQDGSAEGDQPTKHCSVTVGASGTGATMASASSLEELSNTNAEVLLKDNKLESSSSGADELQQLLSSAASAVSTGTEQNLATNGTSKTKSDTENAAQIVVDEAVMVEKKDQSTEQLMEMMPPAAVVEEDRVVAESGDHEQAVADKAEALDEDTQNKGKKSKKKDKKDDDDDENKKEDGGDGVKVVKKSKKTHKVVKKKETSNEGKKVKDKLKKAGDKTAEGKKKGGGRKTAKKDGKEDGATGGTSGEGQKAKSSKAAKKKDVIKPGTTTGAAVSKKKKKKTPKNGNGGGDVQGSNNDGNDNNDKPKKTKKKVTFADSQKDEKSDVKKKGEKKKKIAAAAAGAKKKSGKKSTTAKVNKKKKKSAVTSSTAASNTSTTTTAAPSKTNKNTSSTNTSTSSGNTGKAASDASGAKGTDGATGKTAANGGASPAVVVGNKNVKNGCDNKIVKAENKKNKKEKKKKGKKVENKKGKKDPGKRNTELKRVTVVNFKTGELGMKSLKKKSKRGGGNKGKGKKKRIVPKKQPKPSSQPSKGQRKTTNVVVPQKKERNNPFKILQKFIPDELKIEFPSMYGDMDFKDVSLNMLEKEVDSAAENPQFDPTKVFIFEEEAVDIDSSERVAWLESQMQLFKAKFRDVNTKIKQVERLRRRAVRLYRAKDVPSTSAGSSEMEV